MGVSGTRGCVAGTVVGGVGRDGIADGPVTLITWPGPARCGTGTTAVHI